MIRKINRIFLMACLLLGVAGVTACTPVNSETDGPSTSVVTPDKENEVKIKSIKATETVEAEPVAKMSARKMAAPKKLNSETTSEDAVMAIDEEGNDINYIIIYKSQTDITFTITLDNPEAYGIDDIRITCDDPNSQIWLADGNGSGEWQKIQREADGTSVVGWDSANRYERTYNIRTTSEDAINSFKVVDVRLAGHDKFQSKETEDTDLGNNELHIYKMDEDAYTLNVIENTFDYIKFNFNIKDEYKDIISNIKVDGLEMDEELGYWILEESREVEISYEYYLEEYEVNVERNSNINISTIEFGSSSFIDRPLSWMERREYYGVDGIEYISTIEFYLYFYINTEFKLYFDDYEFNNIVYQVNDSGRYKYYSCYVSFDHVDKYVNSTEGFESDEFKKLTKSLGLDDSLNPAYNIKITSRDIIVNFLNRFTIVINNISYKFSGTIKEYSTIANGKCYEITSIDTLVRMEDK